MEQLFDYDNVSDYLSGYDEINAEKNDTDDHNDAIQVTVDSFAKQNAGVHQPKKVEDIDLHRDSSSRSNNLQPKVLFTDDDPAMIAAVHVSYPQTWHMLCIYHLLENVKKKARAKLRARYYDMLTKYELCYSYLEKLYNSRTSWAKYSVAKVFTAGMESTQRVESIIGVIKKHVDHGTLLKELVNVIEQELEKEA
ncbi:13499_t:CDS:2, partial [Cetraspora pellucida]